MATLVISYISMVQLTHFLECAVLCSNIFQYLISFLLYYFILFHVDIIFLVLLGKKITYRRMSNILCHLMLILQIMNDSIMAAQLLNIYFLIELTKQLCHLVFGDFLQPYIYGIGKPIAMLCIYSLNINYVTNISELITTAFIVSISFYDGYNLLYSKFCESRNKSSQKKSSQNKKYNLSLF